MQTLRRVLRTSLVHMEERRMGHDSEVPNLINHTPMYLALFSKSMWQDLTVGNIVPSS